uniref:PH339R n=1 Tax=African swine fever virus TaxID=10497 RepID=A0A6G7KTX1_ASF
MYKTKMCCICSMQLYAQKAILFLLLSGPSLQKSNRAFMSTFPLFLCWKKQALCKTLQTIRNCWNFLYKSCGLPMQAISNIPRLQNMWWKARYISISYPSMSSKSLPSYIRYELFQSLSHSSYTAVPLCVYISIIFSKKTPTYYPYPPAYVFPPFPTSRTYILYIFTTVLQILSMSKTLSCLYYICFIWLPYECTMPSPFQTSTWKTLQISSYPRCARLQNKFRAAKTPSTKLYLRYTCCAKILSHITVSMWAQATTQPSLWNSTLQTYHRIPRTYHHAFPTSLQPSSSITATCLPPSIKRWIPRYYTSYSTSKRNYICLLQKKI